MTLIQRVLTEEPSRELDEAIFEAVHGRKRRMSAFEQVEPSEPLLRYSSTLDAAVSLMKPGMAWGALIEDDGSATVYMWPDERTKFDMIEGEAATAQTLPAAIVGACLQAIGNET